jgi:hypothetical protein
MSPPSLVYSARINIADTIIKIRRMILFGRERDIAILLVILALYKYCVAWVTIGKSCIIGSTHFGYLPGIDEINFL